MRKENEFGGTYYQMDFPSRTLFILRDLCLSNYDGDRMNDYDYELLYLADRIERELGIE